MKIEVHRAVHRDARGRRMVTVEGISVHVCMDAYFRGPTGNVLPISRICES